MTVIENIFGKLETCCNQFSADYTTAEVINVFSKNYSEDWNTLKEAYGNGGSLQGRYYTRNVYIGLMLRNLSKQGKIQSLDFTDAPKGWGNAEIALFRNDIVEKDLPK